MLWLLLFFAFGVFIGWWIRGTRIRSLEASLEEAERARADHQQQLLTARQELEAVRPQLQDQQDRLTKAEEAREAAHLQAQELEIRLCGAQSEYGALEAQLTQARTDHDALQATLTTAQNDYSSAQGLLAALKRDLSETADARDGAQRDLAQAHHRVTELEALLVGHQDTQGQTQADLAAARQRLADSERTLATTQADHAQTQRQLDAAVQARDAAQQQVAVLEEQVGQAQEAQAECQQTVRTLESRLLAVGAATPAPTVPAEPDDLKRIYGIGPYIEGKLAEIGITTFRQVAQFTDRDIDRVGQHIDFFPDRIRREGWLESARKFHFAKYGERLASSTAPTATTPTLGEGLVNGER
ncbi:MAG: hypothetical protein AAF970_04065 [Bacteroidota bacterium]